MTSMKTTTTQKTSTEILMCRRMRVLKRTVAKGAVTKAARTLATYLCTPDTYPYAGNKPCIQNYRSSAQDVIQSLKKLYGKKTKLTVKAVDKYFPVMADWRVADTIEEETFRHDVLPLIMHCGGHYKNGAAIVRFILNHIIENDLYDRKETYFQSIGEMGQSDDGGYHAIGHAIWDFICVVKNSSVDDTHFADALYGIVPMNDTDLILHVSAYIHKRTDVSPQTKMEDMMNWIKLMPKLIASPAGQS